jgi:hypothetical protein
VPGVRRQRTSATPSAASFCGTTSLTRQREEVIDRFDATAIDMELTKIGEISVIEPWPRRSSRPPGFAPARDNGEELLAIMQPVEYVRLVGVVHEEDA